MTGPAEFLRLCATVHALHLRDHADLHIAERWLRRLGVPAVVDISGGARTLRVCGRQPVTARLGQWLVLDDGQLYVAEAQPGPTVDPTGGHDCAADLRAVDDLR